MGILDDLAMGFGLKERDRDYYDRTAATISRNQGSDAGDRYMSGLGDKYKAAPNYSTAIGPSLADFRQVPNTGAGANPYDASGNIRSDYKPGSAAQRYRDVGRPQPGTLPHMLTRSPGILGLLANLFGGYKPIQPQGELRSSYKPMSATAAPEPVETSVLPAYSGIPADMEAQDSTSPAPLLSTPDVQLEAFTSQPSDPVYMQGGDFDAFVKSTMAFPDFDGIRDNRDLMMDVFEKYRAMHRGKN